MIEYRKGSLFDAPEDFVLAHACNCRGVWGSGVAVEFKKRFPLAYQDYREECAKGMGPGWASLFGRVACLYTSYDYGSRVSTPYLILHDTGSAVADLLRQTDAPIAMPKINSGKFGVPWEDTEKVLNLFSRTFYVYTNES